MASSQARAAVLKLYRTLLKRSNLVGGELEIRKSVTGEWGSYGNSSIGLGELCNQGFQFVEPV